MKIMQSFLYAVLFFAVVVGASKTEILVDGGAGVSAPPRAAAFFTMIPRGGGWFSDNVEESAASAKAKAKEVYDSASTKTSDAVTKAKAGAEKTWLKRVDDLEARLRDEKAKASERLAKEQERMSAQSEKEQKKLKAKIDELQRKLEERKK